MRAEWISLMRFHLPSFCILDNKTTRLQTAGSAVKPKLEVMHTNLFLTIFMCTYEGKFRNFH